MAQHSSHLMAHYYRDPTNIMGFRTHKIDIKNNKSIWARTPYKKQRLNLQRHATLKITKTIASFKPLKRCFTEFYSFFSKNAPRSTSEIPTKMTPRMPIYCWVRLRKLICFSPKSIQFHGLIRKKKNTVSFYQVSTAICSFGCDKLCFLIFLQTSFNCLQNKHLQSSLSYIIRMSKSWYFYKSILSCWPI